MFGKTIGSYLRFEKWVLVALLVVGLVRLGLSLAGAPVDVVRIFSMTVVALGGAAYCGVAVATTGFGTYRHLLPLLFFQAVVVHGVTIVGIGLAGVTGQPNVFTAPEYTRLPNYGPHALGHLAGMLVWPLALWPITCGVMWVTKLIRRGGQAPARA